MLWHPFLLLRREHLHGCPITTLTELPHLPYIFLGHDYCKRRTVKEHAVTCGNAALRFALPNLDKHDERFHLQYQEHISGAMCISYEFLNVTNEMQLLKTLLLSLLYMFPALLAHHQELTKTVRAAYSDGMR